MNYPRYTKHGHAPKHGKRSNIYRRWQHMVQRCHNPNDRDYTRYGDKYISVCDRWRIGDDLATGFEYFLQDMGLPPDQSYSIDRIDVYGNYEPSNCRWATPKEQANNRSNTKFLTIDGVTKPLSAWSSEYGIGSKTVLYRLKQGLTHKQAVTNPLKGNKS